MQSPEIVLAFVLALAAIIAGYLLFRHYFDLDTLKPKPQYQGMRRRVRAKVRAYAAKVALILLIVAAVGLLAYLGIRFGGPLVRALKARIPWPQAAAEPAAQVDPTPAEQPEPAAPSYPFADHRIVDEVRLDRLSPLAIELAKTRLRIFYICGTHGSQVTYGLKGLPAFKGPMYDGLRMATLELPDRSKPDLQSWADQVRLHLADPENRGTNVLMWSWTNELATATGQDVADYLQLGNELEAEYPGLRFVYMTGHVDGSGLSGNVHQRNEQIRAYCREHGKNLYDFADIESYDPDGNFYGDKSVNDGCWYDSDANGSLDRNWAKEWSEANPGKWYDCYAAHSFPLNANMKAYAAWWLWAQLAEEESSSEGNN
jgi:hypothetical protein